MNHFDEQGNARMVDVSEKGLTARSATAEAVVLMNEATRQAIINRDLAKGDVLQVARLAGIMAAKRTADLIPLCHPIPITGVDLDFEFPEDEETCAVRIVASVHTVYRTGVEMEALTVCSTAALTIYDMCKSIDRAMTISTIRLLEKSGGQNGTYVR